MEDKKSWAANYCSANQACLCVLLLFWKIEVIPRTATKFLSLLLSCVALGSDTQGTHKEQNLFFVRRARWWKLELHVQKNRSIKPKIMWKAKKYPDVWQGQHRALEVQQALISLTQEITGPTNQFKNAQKARNHAVFRAFSFPKSLLSFVRFWKDLTLPDPVFLD